MRLLLMALGLLGLSSLPLGASMPSIIESTVDVRPYDLVVPGRFTERYRLATWTVKFSEKLNILDTDTGEVYNISDFNMPQGEYEQFNYLSTTMMHHGLSLRMNCTNHNFGTMPSQAGLFGMPTDFLLMVPPISNPAANFFKEVSDIYDDILETNENWSEDRLTFLSVVAWHFEIDSGLFSGYYGDSGVGIDPGVVGDPGTPVDPGGDPVGDPVGDPAQGGQAECTNWQEQTECMATGCCSWNFATLACEVDISVGPEECMNPRAECIGWSETECPFTNCCVWDAASQTCTGDSTAIPGDCQDPRSVECSWGDEEGCDLAGCCKWDATWGCIGNASIGLEMCQDAATVQCSLSHIVDEVTCNSELCCEWSGSECLADPNDLDCDGLRGRHSDAESSLKSRRSASAKHRLQQDILTRRGRNFPDKSLKARRSSSAGQSPPRKSPPRHPGHNDLPKLPKFLRSMALNPEDLIPPNSKRLQDNAQHQRQLLQFGTFTGPDNLTWSLYNLDYLQDCTVEAFDGSSEAPMPRYQIVEYGTTTAVESSASTPKVDPECVVSDLLEVQPKIESTISELDTSNTQDKFDRGIKTLQVLKLMDGYAGCQALVNGMVSFTQQSNPVSDSRDCVEDTFTDEGLLNPAWQEDPCCNPIAAFSQCCAPRTVDKMQRVLQDISVPESCKASLDASELSKLEGALESYKESVNSFQDASSGCAAIRESKTSKERQDELFKFYQTCYNILFEGKTTQGETSCNQNSDCYTEQCVSGQGFIFGPGAGGAGGGGGKTCAVPFDDFARPFLRCAVDKMDEELLFFFYDRLQLSIDDPTSPQSRNQVAEALEQQFGLEDCSGYSAKQGACMVNVTRTQCESLDGLGYNSFVWREDSPVDSKCKYEWFWYDQWNTECNGTCQCANDIESQVDGALLPLSTEFLRFANEWGWQGDQFQPTAFGNKEYCLWEKSCNHLPFWEEVSKEECESPPDGDEYFCGIWEYGQYSDLSRAPRCTVSRASLPNATEEGCKEVGGIFYNPFGYECWECCRLDVSTVEECVPAVLAPRTYQQAASSWTFDSSIQVPTVYFPQRSEITVEEEFYDPYWSPYLFFEDTSNDMVICYNDTMTEDECLASAGEWRDFTPHNDSLPSVCVLGQGKYENYFWWDPTQTWSGSGMISSSPKDCAGKLQLATAWSDGVRNTAAKCGEGVCSSNPRDASLVASCAGQGECTEPCPRESCQRSGNPRICILPLSQAECQNDANMQWHLDLNGGGFCVNDETSDASFGYCTSRPDAEVVSCGDLRVEDECDQFQDPPILSDRNISIYFDVMSCFIGGTSECLTQQECESGAGECSDHRRYFSPDNDKICHMPLNVTFYGAPDDSKCYEFQSDPRVKQVFADWWDGCIVHIDPQVSCADIHRSATEEKASSTREECLSRKRCFDTDRWMATPHGETECTTVCPSNFQWQPIDYWWGGSWITNQIDLDSTKWTKRGLISKNNWTKVVPEGAIQMLLDDAIFSIIGTAYANEIFCEMEPPLAILSIAACSCGQLEGSDSAYCGQLASEVQSAQIQKQPLFASDKLWVSRNPIGSFGFDLSDLKNPGRSDVIVEYVSHFWLPETSGGLRNTQHKGAGSLRRVSKRATTIVECERYEMVPNRGGQIIGQVIGSGMAVSGLTNFQPGTEMEVCLNIDSEVPLCTSKYPLPDFALGMADKTPGAPLGLSDNVTFDGPAFCAHVILPDQVDEMLLFPILRTQDLMPFVAHSGQIVSGHVEFSSYASISIFGIRRQLAFRESLAETLGFQTIDASDIVITKVCDIGTSDCTEFALRRNALRHSVGSSGILVDFNVQIDGAPAASEVEAQMRTANFGGDFENAYLAHVGGSEVAGMDFHVDSLTQGVSDDNTTYPWPHITDNGYKQCKCTFDWPELVPKFQSGEAVTGGLGRLMTADFQVWMCFHDPQEAECQCSTANDAMCYAYSENEGMFYPWGRNSELQLFNF